MVAIDHLFDLMKPPSETGRDKLERSIFAEKIGEMQFRILEKVIYYIYLFTLLVAMHECQLLPSSSVAGAARALGASASRGAVVARLSTIRKVVASRGSRAPDVVSSTSLRIPKPSAMNTARSAACHPLKKRQWKWRR